MAPVSSALSKERQPPKTPQQHKTYLQGRQQGGEPAPSFFCPFNQTPQEPPGQGVTETDPDLSLGASFWLWRTQPGSHLVLPRILTSTELPDEVLRLHTVYLERGFDSWLEKSCFQGLTWVLCETRGSRGLGSLSGSS